jgi:S1-C subfamily serine protease
MSIARQIQAGKASSTIVIGQRAIIGVNVVSVACAQGNGQGCPGGQNPFSNFFFGGGYNPPVHYGAVVYNVDQGSPAAGAGISIGDVIVSVDGAKVSTLSTLTGALGKDQVGQKVTIGWVNSRGTPSKATVTLIAGPNI